MLDSQDRLATYLNPVYSKSFPDPFVLKYRGEYFAYSTGFAPDGDVFMTLRSSDLVTWTEVGGVMKPLPDSPPYYWAPEVTYSNGKFYLYYSVGNETLMEIRLAVSDRPDGGFLDTGSKLTTEDFAIDAHVFMADDGSKYLFYATDFLEHTHIGTGTVVDRMRDWNALEGDARPVTRAKYDWQVYDPNRKEKGGVRWHTVEGPTVLKRKGVYYEMFSGGNWQNTTYGVSFAVSDSLEQREEWAQFSDGVNVLPILRTIPGVVDGPGHNSVVRGLNNRELYCVYHRWVNGERVLAIDRMDFTGDRIFVIGPTNSPQPLPLRPAVRESFRDRHVSESVTLSGNWHFTEEGAVSTLGICEMRIAAPASFLLELSIRFSAATGNSGLILETASGPTTIRFRPVMGVVEINPGPTGSSSSVALPACFLPEANHLVRLECDHRRFRIAIDDLPLLRWQSLDASAMGVTILSDEQSITVGSIDLTAGFEELFEDEASLADRGWEIEGVSDLEIADGSIIFSESAFVMRKGPAMRDLEMAANFRIAVRMPTGEFGLTLTDENHDTFHFLVDPKRYVLEVRSSTSETFPLPANLDLTQYHQLRIMKLGSRAICYFDDVVIGEFGVANGAVRASISGNRMSVAIEMIRLTGLG